MIRFNVFGGCACKPNEMQLTFRFILAFTVVFNVIRRRGIAGDENTWRGGIHRDEQGPFPSSAAGCNLNQCEF